MTDLAHAGGTPRRTSISVYQDDADWLRGLQREISFKRDTYITLHDLIHELIERSKTIEKGM